MATMEDCRIVSEAVRGLCEPLHEMIPEAWDEADRFFVEREMPERDHRGGRAHLARQLIRRQLRRAGSIDGWTMPEGCRPNSELNLTRGLMTLKLLRPGLPGAGAVPDPGKNHARMRYYRNPQLDLFGAEGSNLIIVWDVEDSGEAALRVVRTTGAWRALGRERVDIDFMLPSLAEHVSNLEFVPSDEAMELPFFQGDEADEGEDDGTVSPSGG